ncbi:hypothetical protein, partial [Cryobacterium sp. MLB-32]|uniref:hypothetical protein n=1 Tax=Cryobacterium sp. MLB-32 TaxID=1529318 RepID=UPI0005644BB2
GRQMNALRLTADDVRSQVAMVRTAYVSDASVGKAKDAELLRLTRHQARLQEIADALGLKSDVTKPLVNNTAIIEEVARTVHDEELSIGSINLIWRTGSAAAHGGRSFAIARLNRGEIRTGASGDKFARLSGDLQTDVGPAAAAAAMALSGAFKLFDERGRRP